MNFLKKWIEEKKKIVLLQGRQKAIQRIKDAVWVLKNIDEDLKKQGYNRKTRKQFWVDLVKYEEIRQDIFTRMLEQYELQEVALEQQKPLSFLAKIRQYCNKIKLKKERKQEKCKEECQCIQKEEK